MVAELYAIVGGPCSGKSSVITRLGNKGYYTVPESATDIIIRLKGINPSYNPANDRYAFQDVVAKTQLEREQEALANKRRRRRIFVDRGVFDGIGYCEVDGIGLPESRIPLPPDLRNLNPAHYKRVFFLTPLPPECYEQTIIREEDRAYAARITEAIRAVYVRKVSDLVDVPFFDTNGNKKQGIDKRVDFILARLVN